MKKIICLSASFILALTMCSCSSFKVTKDLNEALAHVEEDIEYHDQIYMTQKELSVPHGVNEEKLGELRFNFAFEQGSKNELSVNHLSDNEWRAFKREFENAIAGTKRFPIGQITQGLGDNELRKTMRQGTNNTSELDVSEMVEATGIIHIIPTITSSEALAKQEKTANSTFKIICNPLSAKNNQLIDDFQPFSVQIQGKVYQATDRLGRVVGGFRFINKEELEDYHIKQGRAVIVKFFNKIYNIFPVGGEVVNFDEDGLALMKANRAMGLQPNMECVIYAMKKGDPDAIRVPLYNATAVSVGQTGNSTLKIWRKSEKNSAKKIIKLIEEDFDSARYEYNFFAASDGFAQWPDFIDPLVEK